MSLKDFELYHGAALVQVIRNPNNSIKVIERVSEKHPWGMYLITDDSGDYLLYVKSTGSVNNNKKGKNRCGFSFSPDEIKKMGSCKKENLLLLCLVCDNEEICLLDNDDINEFNLLNKTRQFNLAVSWTENSSLTVKCQKVKLSHQVPRNRLRKFVSQRQKTEDPPAIAVETSQKED